MTSRYLLWLSFTRTVYFSALFDTENVKRSADFFQIKFMYKPIH